MSPNQGAGDGPGTQVRLPKTTASSWPRCSRISHFGITTWRSPGRLSTSGGSLGAIQCVPCSCQRATGASDSFRHSGGAPASPSTGAPAPCSVCRFASAAGLRRFSKVPSGPIRRYGSPRAPSTTTSGPSLRSSIRLPVSTSRTRTPGTAGVRPSSVVSKLVASTPPAPWAAAGRSKETRKQRAAPRRSPSRRTEPSSHPALVPVVASSAASRGRGGPCPRRPPPRTGRPPRSRSSCERSMLRRSTSLVTSTAGRPATPRWPSERTAGSAPRSRSPQARSTATATC